jgi:hypothetical protein
VTAVIALIAVAQVAALAVEAVTAVIGLIAVAQVAALAVEAVTAVIDSSSTSSSIIC